MIACLRNLFKSPFEPPAELWTTTRDSINIAHPIIRYDNSVSDIMVKKSREEVLGDPDFWLWEWNEVERIIDSEGKVYKPKFEVRGRWNSGTYPEAEEKIIKLDEFKNLVIGFLKTQDDKAQASELIGQVESEKSIANIMVKIEEHL